MPAPPGAPQSGSGHPSQPVQPGPPGAAQPLLPGQPGTQSWPASPQPWNPQGPQPIIESGHRRPVWIFPAIVAAVILLALGTVGFVLRDRILSGGDAAGPGPAPVTVTATTGTPETTKAAPAPTATTAQPTPTTQGPPTLPASVGSVRLDPSLDPAQAPAVAAVFDQYFTAVNARNAGAALAVMDPNGSINQGDAAAVKRFSDGISTSTDDDILLLALGPDPTGKGILQARVTFRSQQGAGKGPKGREQETCTRWDVTYSLTKPGDYRIWGSTNAGNRPC
ncbi:hypothetical protein [Dactylosporangium sp. CA-233914]|uniref:hypothetical protein n=1 Tax=Dactylosporangium sp. CA-233914 TaxID=3239934 RepID=UPI003D91F53C